MGFGAAAEVGAPVALGDPAGGGAAGAALLSGFELCAGAPGAGAGVELLHPLKIKVAERTKLAAKTKDFSRMGRSPEIRLELNEIYG